jgi:type II secretory ATPase GspE/PulE/Tfp pilus assembly ATPase PilB-like protein
MDPDLILVGEIRDRDSAIVAARAALSGRLVLATIHAHDAVGAVDALHYLGVPHHIIGSSLRLIIAQNLVRRLCSECAQPRELDETERELFAKSGRETTDTELNPDGLLRPDTLLHPGSCAECNWYGYKGRTGVFEVAAIDDEVGALISAGAHRQELVDCLRAKGMRSMVQDGLDKVTQGVTSMEELCRIGGFPRPGEPQSEQADAAAAVAG